MMFTKKTSVLLASYRWYELWLLEPGVLWPSL